jgi:hypothetical protein
VTQVCFEAIPTGAYFLDTVEKPVVFDADFRADCLVAPRYTAISKAEPRNASRWLSWHIADRQLQQFDYASAKDASEAKS